MYKEPKAVTDNLQQKLPRSNIIISMVEPREDDLSLHFNTQIVNVLIRKEFEINGCSNISICDNSNMYLDPGGNPKIAFLDDKDRYHLSDRGVSNLAANFKNAI